MISLPLLKQSIKANGITWLLVTLATAGMLGILIVVLGGINSNEIRDSLKESFIKSEIDAHLKAGAIDGYVTAYQTIQTLYPSIKETYDSVTFLSQEGINTYQYFVGMNHPDPFNAAIDAIVAQVDASKKDTTRYLLTEILIFYKSNPSPQALNQFLNQLVINLVVTGLNQEVNEEIIQVVQKISEQILAIYAEKHDLTNEEMQMIARLFIENSFYDNLEKENESAKEFLDAFGYSSMYELLAAFDYTVTSVNALISSGIIQYTSFINSGMEPEQAKSEATKSLFTQMPDKVAESLTELGELNIDHLVIGTVFFKIAGLLLPIVYTITTANNLIAGQVDSGSMAFVLSTPTKRKKVTITQMFYLIISLFIMYFIIGGVGVLTAKFAREGEFSIPAMEIFKLSIGGFVTMMAISGINFLTSAWFNRSKHAVGVGGGLSMFFLVATILGLFGSTTIPKALRIEAMNLFNYTTIITLFDAEKILTGGTYLYGVFILLGIAVITYVIGIIRFDKKDLPL